MVPFVLPESSWASVEFANKEAANKEAAKEEYGTVEPGTEDNAGTEEFSTKEPGAGELANTEPVNKEHASTLAAAGILDQQPSSVEPEEPTAYHHNRCQRA